MKPTRPVMHSTTARCPLWTLLSLWISRSLWRSSLLLLCLLSAPAMIQAVEPVSDIRVIAHRDVKVDSLTKMRLRSIFGMRTRTWPEGELIQVFVLTDDDPTHVQFTKEVLRTFPYNLRRIWDRRVYSGTGQSPVVVNSEEEMRDVVSHTENSIGYVRDEWVDASVKILELK
ncbi:hypothetical protein FKG94_22340 [Exilibacterium tricleocarpae]|uniref:PBP domain-containing protein n=1 Tax=Exilibacterium tricleocarpae TaxID=2591008 RepID=A0A545SY52_9GAMM|nr:hypothetical protein [Exilibacterium tricleocarpae]TQV69895.1 hypothetical protein FKG94_22340 [Exilibacterium tricleocarpae]